MTSLLKKRYEGFVKNGANLALNCERSRDNKELSQHHHNTMKHWRNQ